jgi:hypothetical protein
MNALNRQRVHLCEPRLDAHASALQRMCSVTRGTRLMPEPGMPEAKRWPGTASLGHTASATGSRERATINGTVTEAMRDEVTETARTI